MRTCIGWFALLTVALLGSRLGGGQAARPQPEAVTTATHASAAEVQRWLAGEDPRMVAWGAYFAAKSGDESAATAMMRLAERWPGRTDGDAAAHWGSAMAMTAILDALILDSQNGRHEAVPAAGVTAVAREFPVQATILASRLPAAEATPLLLEWYGESGNAGRDGALEGDLVRVAAMLLARAPPPGFAASVLEGVEVRLQVWVMDPGTGRGSGMGGGCCADGGIGHPPEGWPPLYRYGWEENAPRAQGSEPADPVLVEAGGDRITYRRSLVYSAGGGCHGVRILTAETRRHLVAEMAGVGADELGWKVQDQESIEWRDAAQFQRDFAGAVGAEEKKLRATADALAARGAMTKAEAKRSLPRLEVTVTDARTLGGGALPALAASDSRTTIAFAEQ